MTAASNIVEGDASHTAKTKMSMEWTREKTLALIQEYRKRPGLWDMTHEDYRKKEVKHKLLEEVGNVLGGNIPIMEIEKKFHTLRTQYHREINRMKRKEPYNSKWFGFKYLQFLSSPKACRSSKGRIKSEITDEGTVTTKYIIPETITPNNQDTSHTSAGSGNENEEFVTVQRRPTTITYESVPSISHGSASSSRSHELEKLIEETTKDVEDIEDAKPKIIKEMTMPLEQHHQHHVSEAYGQPGSVGELQITSVESEHEELHHIEDVVDNMDPIHIQTCSEEELNYQGSNCGKAANGAVGVSPTASSTTTIHTLPARIIKIQRRDTHNDENEHYYEHQQHQGHTQHNHHPQQQQHHHVQHHHQQHYSTPLSSQHHMQTVSPSPSGCTTKRYYYDASGHHTATILTSTATPPQQQQLPSKTIISSSQDAKINVRSSLIHSPQGTASSPSTTSGQNATIITASSGSATILRDEYSIYGEYVANEIRCIKNREILIALKHKINTALFEANMQELQK